MMSSFENKQDLSDLSSSLKKFLISIYFGAHNSSAFKDCELLLKYHDLKILKALFLPKRFYRRYFIELLNNTRGTSLIRYISFKEKESVLFFLRFIDKENNS